MFPQQANQSDEGRLTAPFFAVSLAKLVIMSVCTFGVYEMYWLYKNWKLIKEREWGDISPFWRAFFAEFYVYQCFSRIRKYGATNGIVHGFSPAEMRHERSEDFHLAAGWIATRLGSFLLPDPLWIITFMSVVFMLPVQAYANQINASVSPRLDANSRLNIGNWVCILAVGVVVALWSM